MNIKLELLKGYMYDLIDSRLDGLEIDVCKIADTVAINMLSEIQNIIKDENYSDFEVVEQIVRIFEKYRIDFGTRHDF